jgi:hypothetical protein
MGQPQNSCHVTTAHFGSRFSNLAVKLSRFFGDQHTRLRPFSFEHERCRSTGKRAPDDCDIVFEIHRNPENGRG